MRPRTHQRHRSALPAFLEDLLETYHGEWFTKSTLWAIAADRRPHVNRDAFERAYFRVKARPRIDPDRAAPGGRVATGDQVPRAGVPGHVNHVR